MRLERVEVQAVVIGAGVVGLAVARELSATMDTFVLEAHSKFGQETSSRNSEVVHSGIYYPKDSNKTRWCIEGQAKLYEFCEANGVPFRKTGKLVVATSDAEQDYLEGLFKHSTDLGVGVERLTSVDLQRAEPLIHGQAALLFAETGIVDSHQVMQVLETQSIERGAQILYSNRVSKVEPLNGGWLLQVEDPEMQYEVFTERLINCAGLAAAKFHRMLTDEPYEHRFCSGRYLQLSSKFRGKFGHLVYPVPDKDGLGIHVTLDLEGNIRLGPDTHWSSIGDDQDWTSIYKTNLTPLVDIFLNRVQKYIHGVAATDMEPGFLGIRPKLFHQGEPIGDFVLKSQGSLVSCLGIESPGLTSSLVIAQRVMDMVRL